VDSRSRLLAVAASAFVFGVGAALVAGQDWDGTGTVGRIRNNIGNLSAPWLIIALVAGATTTRLRTGAACGIVATYAALLGFYVLTAFVGEVRGNGFADDFRRLLGANGIWFVAGLLSGPLVGAIGACSRRWSWVAVGLVASAFMIGEPVVIALIGVLHPAAAVGRDGPSVVVHAGQAVAGVALLLMLLLRSSAPARADSPPPSPP
jgi:hypothetical protein